MTASWSSNAAMRGIFWMVLTGLSFVIVTALVKAIGGRIPAAQSAFLRYVLGLVFLLPMLKPIWTAGLTGRQIGLFAGRGMFHTIGVALWFWAMASIPMAEVTSINYLNPIWTTIGAALIFGERLAVRRIAAIAVALLGVLLIMRPGFRDLDPAHIGMIGTTLCFAAGFLIAKQLSGEVSPAVVVGMLSITVTIGLAPLAFMNWVQPTWNELLILFAVACFATAGHYTMTLAFAAAPISVTQPVTFLQLVWSVVIGATIFGEAVDPWVIFGGTLIVVAISYMAWREARLKAEPPQA